MWKDGHSFDVVHGVAQVAALQMAAGNLCGLGAIFAVMRMWRGF
jgi:hypothetical protein